MRQGGREREYEPGTVFVEPTAGGRAVVVFDGWEVAEVPLGTDPHISLAKSLHSAVVGTPASASFESRDGEVAEVFFHPNRDMYRICWPDGSRAEGFANLHVALLQCLQAVERDAFALVPGASETEDSREKWRLVGPLIENVQEWRCAVGDVGGRLGKALSLLCIEKRLEVLKRIGDPGRVLYLVGPLSYCEEYGTNILDSLEIRDLAKLVAHTNDEIARLIWTAAESHFRADLDLANEDFVERAEFAFQEELAKL